jgi:hypothetical protein
MAASGQVQHYVASAGAAAAWTARSYPGDRLTAPLNDIFDISPFGAVRIWADTDVIALALELVNNGVTGGQFIVCGANLFRVLSSGAFATAAHSAPADAALAAGDMAIWFDQTNGAGKLMIKGKTANGTVVTGSVTLT